MNELTSYTGWVLATVALVTLAFVLFGGGHEIKLRVKGIKHYVVKITKFDESGVLIKRGTAILASVTLLANKKLRIFVFGPSSVEEVIVPKKPAKVKRSRFKLDRHCDSVIIELKVDEPKPKKDEKIKVKPARR